MDPNKEVQLFVNGCNDKTHIIQVSKDCTTADIFKAVSEKIDIPEGFRLLAGTKELRSSTSLGLNDYNLKSDSTLFVVFRLRGGKLPGETEEELPNPSDFPTPKWSLKPLPGYVQITNIEPCMITLENDSSPRAKMSCGHVISPDGMLNLYESCKSSNRYQFVCPEPGCEEEWPLFVVCHVANITGQDRANAEKFVSEMYARRTMGVQQCPGCLSYCMPIDKKPKTVRCVVCPKVRHTNFEFCWSCLHETTGTSCNNSNCDGKDPRVKHLANCPRTKMEYTDLETPSLRACPKCHIIIEHAGGCKTMTCTSAGCKCQFCFVCLKVSAGSGLPCGSYKSLCQTAPAQTAFD